MASPTIPADLEKTVRHALEEDIGSGDLTAKLLDKNHVISATVVCRGPAVICGVPWFEEVFRQLDPALAITWQVSDGDLITADTTICTINGTARAVLTGERTALNFIQLLSATATVTHEYCQLIQGTKATLLDTRKTIPGLRTAQKYAVLCGGGNNHRMGLYDAILIKENHIGAAGDIASAFKKAQKIHQNVEIEVENIEELRQALDAGATQILLDNFDLTMMQQAVQINNGKATLEVSGGVERETIRSIAETGIDYISVGALTKNIRAIDFSMRIEK